MLTTVPQGHEFALKLGSVRGETRVIAFRIEEGLSAVPRCEVELISEMPDLAFDDVMDQGAALTIVDRKEGSRVFSGLVSEFSQGDTGHRWTAYRATIEPALHRLQYRSDSRIFQQKSVQDILAEVLNEAGVSQHRFTLIQKRPAREFTVQYRESDYDFFARLCAEEGLVFYHVFEDGQAILEINDSLASAAPTPGLDGAITYKPAGGGVDPDMPSFIQRFEYKERLRAGNLAQRDYWFKKPAYFWDQKAEVSPAPLQAKKGSAGKDLNLYDGVSRGHHDEGDASARRYAKYRLEQHRKDGATGKGRSTVAQLVPGFGFKMEGSQQKGLNQKYLVTRIIHEGKQPQALDADAPEEASDYFNHFEVIPSGIEWRAEHYWHSDAPRKPRVDGPQLARVVGPAGEEIFCDEYGRVKLQFPWDRHGKGDEHSSCWVRVSQLWAGTKYGGMAIPRIGQEVIVEFLDGDIDQPIITGRTYNATNQVPYDLPVNKTRTTIKTDTHKGKGSNELRFEDEAGKEEVYLHAEMNMVSQVKNDKISFIKAQEIKHVTGNSFEEVQGIKMNEIGGDFIININGDGVQDNAVKAFNKDKVNLEYFSQLYRSGKETKNQGSLSINANGRMVTSAQKGMMTNSGHDHTTTISGRKSIFVGKGSSSNVVGTFDSNIGGNCNLKIDGDVFVSIGEFRMAISQSGNISINGASLNIDFANLIKILAAKVKIN